MKHKNKTKLLLSTIFIVISFFVGYNFGVETNNYEIKKLSEKKDFVNLEIKNGKLNISKQNDNIIILINGKKISSGSLDLK